MLAGKERGGRVECGHAALKANVYVDGFNLYRGLLRGSPCKWLDPKQLCERLYPQ
jgi:hypothetical protein